MDRLLPLPSPLLPPFFFFLLLLCNSSLLLHVCSLNSEGTALLSFRDSMREDPANCMINWNSTDQTPCAWNGVTCSGDGAVTSLSLPRKKLVGFLPSALSSLRSLRHVNLRSNRLFGRIPAGLFGAEALQSLVLYGNFLSGSLPPEIGGLLYLQRLDLSGNLLAGAVPTTLLRCRRLRVLVLSHNNFSGTLPVGFGSDFVGLERLDLSYNAFNGTIPSNIGSLTNLQGTLDLSHNWFSGSIPPSLGNLPERVYIDLTHNNLSGPIPQNGALENRGPTAFIGNPGLCGPPLKNPCSSTSPSFSPFSPSNFSPSAVEGNGTHGYGGSAGRNGGNTSTGLSQDVLIWIVVSDVVGIGLIALIFFYCYKKAIASITAAERGGQNSDKGSKERKECNCFRKEESETFSENVEQHELVPLDKNVAFNLDELLKASAFVLGKSGIGIVYKVVMDDGRTLAVRRLGEGGSQRFKEFQTEVEAIGKVRHPNIVALRAYYWSVEEKLLIYDYIPNGNLHSAIHGKAGAAVLSPLSWEARLKIMKGVSKGLAFLHEFSPKKYVHGDLRPNNVLLGHDMEPYISDFGVGRLANIAGGTPLQSDRMATEKLQSQQSDTPVKPIQSKGSVYHAPEALRTLKPSQKWDVYSYGVILLELISGRSATIILETLEMDLVHWIQLCIEEKKPLLDVLDTSLARQLHNEDEIIAVLKIALACVQTNPEKRPSMRHVADSLENMN